MTAVDFGCDAGSHWLAHSILVCALRRLHLKKWPTIYACVRKNVFDLRGTFCKREENQSARQSLKITAAAFGNVHGGQTNCLTSLSLSLFFSLSIFNVLLHLVLSHVRVYELKRPPCKVHTCQREADLSPERVALFFCNCSFDVLYESAAESRVRFMARQCLNRLFVWIVSLL